MNKKQMVLNLIGQILSLSCGIGISLILTPFIVDHLGKETYGYVGLANNFIGYIGIATTALTGMLSRYVTVEYSKGNYDKASGYFSTAYFTEIIIALVLVLPTALLVSKMDSIFEMTTGIVADVKILWALTFFSFLLGLSFGGFGCGIFAKNRLEVTAIINIANKIINVAILFVTFVFFTPKVWYIGLAAICSNITSITMSFFAQRKITPQLNLNIKLFDKKYIYDLVVVGIWNSLNKLQQILITGLDLLLTNLFINGGEMGLLSIAKTLPGQVSTLIGTVSGTFDPTMTIAYGKGEKDDLLHQTNFAMKFTGFVCSVPILGIIAYGLNFYELWQPSLSQEELVKVQILACLTLLPQVFSVYIYPLYNINTITCKLKVPVLVSLCIGLANLVIVFILLRTTNLGVYAVAGVSSILWICRIFTFVPLYAAHNLQVDKKTFYGPLFRGVVNVIVVGTFMVVTSQFLHASSWIIFVPMVVSVGLLGYIICFFVMFKKEERREALAIIKKKLPIKK